MPSTRKYTCTNCTYLEAEPETPQPYSDIGSSSSKCGWRIFIAYMCVCFLSHYFLTGVDGWSNDSNQFVCFCLVSFPNVSLISFRHFSFWRFVFVSFCFVLNFRVFWIASNSPCQWTDGRNKKQMNGCIYKILISYQTRFSRCWCCGFVLCFCCQNGEGSQMMMNALLSVCDDGFCWLGREENGKKYQ